MSTNENGGAPVPTPNHAGAAQERILELRRWREQIPHFVIPTAADAAKRLSNAASVPPQFVELTNVAVANEPMLVRVESLTPAEVRNFLRYADAYGPLADELEALAHFVRFSVKSAKHRAGIEALTRYALAQRLARLPENSHLKPYVDDMRRALGRMKKPTPEEAAQRAAQRAEKAAAKLAAKAAKLLPAAEPDPSMIVPISGATAPDSSRTTGSVDTRTNLPSHRESAHDSPCSVVMDGSGDQP